MASCGVNINVIRDAAPTFIPTSYYLQIDETSPINKQNPPLLVVTATDSDRKVWYNKKKSYFCFLNLNQNLVDFAKFCINLILMGKLNSLIKMITLISTF